MAMSDIPLDDRTPSYPPASHSPMTRHHPSCASHHQHVSQSLDEVPASPSMGDQVVTREEPMRLRGGGMFNCCVGRLHVESGPCVCTTSTNGLLCCIPCLIIFPFNAAFGGLFGLVNCIMCNSCSGWTCVLFSPTPETEGIITNPGTYQ